MCSGEVIRLLKCGHSEAHFKTRCGWGCKKPIEPEYFEIDDTCHECTAGHKISAARTYYDQYVARKEAGRTIENSLELDHTFDRLRLALDEEETKILRHSPTNENTPFLPHTNMTEFDLSCEWVEGKCVWSNPPTTEPRAIRRIAGIYPETPYHDTQPRSEPDGLESLSSPYFRETTDYGDYDDEYDSESHLSGSDSDDDMGPACGELVDWLAVADRQSEPETGPPVPTHKPQGPRMPTRLPTRLPFLLPSGMLDPVAAREGAFAAAGQQPKPYKLQSYRRDARLARAAVSRWVETSNSATTMEQCQQEETPLIGSDVGQPSGEKQQGNHNDEDEYQYDGFERWARLKEALKKRDNLALTTRA
jgi:hypothetical protein